MPEQRRLDRVLEPGYLDGLADRPVEEVSALKAECTELETEVSFVRRLAQGRIDILDAERDRRARGGRPGGRAAPPAPTPGAPGGPPPPPPTPPPPAAGP